MSSFFGLGHKFKLVGDYQCWWEAFRTTFWLSSEFDIEMHIGNCYDDFRELARYSTSLEF